MRGLVRIGLVIGLLATVLAAGAAAAAAQGMLRTNEADIEEATRNGELDVSDPIAVFAFVLGQLPERVKVLPTENYYYFRFMQNGVPYTGNIRLAANDRDEGKLHFFFGDVPNEWRTQILSQRLVLDASKDVTVTKLENLSYRVSHGGKSVVFALNDLSQAKPPAALLHPDETFIGPVFDESGIRFFLVFNSQLKVFHYLLDETGKVADDFVPTKETDRIVIGKRTGFAFYQLDGRKVLIGANERNSQLNTPFDGPFDQLPENFIEGDMLRDAIVAAEPSLKDKVDRLGNLADRRDRYLIHPYMLYRRTADLAVFHRCMTHKRVREAVRPRCFVIADNEAQKRNPLPLGLRKRR